MGGGCGLSYAAAFVRRRVLCHEAARLGALTGSIEVLIESGIIGLIRFAERMAACKADTRGPPLRPIRVLVDEALRGLLPGGA
jgi:hypothetical protein